MSQFFFSYLFYFWFFVHKVNRVVFALKLASDNVWMEICYPMVPFVVLCQAWTFGPLILLVRKSIGGQYVPASFGLASAILHSDHIIQIDTYCTSITFLCLINLQLHTHYKLTKLTLLLLEMLGMIWNPYFDKSSVDFKIPHWPLNGLR